MEKPCVQWFKTALENEVKTNPDFGMCERTISDYTYQVYLIYRQLGKPYNEKLTIDEAIKWKAEEGQQYGSKTLAAKTAALNRYLQLVCDYNGKPLKVKNIECKRNKTVLSYEQIKDMIDFYENKGKHTEAMMIYIGFHAGGPRKDNMHRIKLRDLILEGNRKGIRFTEMKGNREHICPISDETAEKIKHYIEHYRPEPVRGHEQYLFLMSFGKVSGKKVYSNKYDLVLKYCARKLGITDPVHPHCIRRSFIMWMRRQGKRVEEIKPFTGHKSVKTLYESYIVEEDRESAYKFLNGGSMSKPDNTPAPQPTSMLQSDIDKLLELERLRNENLRLQAGIPPIQEPERTTIGHEIRDVL
jgi:integrase